MRKDVNDMFEIKGKVTTAICYAKVIEDEAIEQIRRMCDYDLTRGSKVRIMPDVHAGKGCTIGTTMTITDKICPNIVAIYFSEHLTGHFYNKFITFSSIARHSDYSLQGITDERELLHAQIIRDADKLDNCRVKLENPIETMLGVPEEAVGMSEISREVMQQFENQTSVLLETRRTKMDYWLSYLAYFFDINFKVTYEIINDNHYVDKLIGRIPYINPKTRKEMERVRAELNQYIQLVLN